MEAVALVAENWSQVAISKKLGCDRKTIRKWMQLPAFKEAVEKRANASADALQGQIQEVKHDVLSLSDEMKHTLEEALHAERKGEPDWWPRMKALEFLLRMTGMISYGAPAKTGEAATAQAGVMLVISPEDIQKALQMANLAEGQLEQRDKPELPEPSVVVLEHGKPVE